MRDLFSRMGILGELLGFFWKRKLYWLLPMLVMLIIFAVLIVMATASGATPFIYTIF